VLMKFPKRSIGTFRTSITNPWSRIDTSQHIIDSLRKLRSLKIKKSDHDLKLKGDFYTAPVDNNQNSSISEGQSYMQ